MSDIDYVVHEEKAKIEISEWLKAKKIKPKTLEDLSYSVGVLEDAVESGNLIVNEDNTLTQILDFPIENGDKTVREITYKFRITPADLNKYRRSIEKSDHNLMLVLMALTDEPKHILNKLDMSYDNRLSEAISFFFV